MTLQNKVKAIKDFSELKRIPTRNERYGNKRCWSLLGKEQSGKVNAIGYDLYIEMLEAISEINWQEIPEVKDTQIDFQ